jgi:glycosyltransferase involved in cell wall biosynthesis
MTPASDSRVGLLARCTRSGLGYLSRSFHDHYRPAATLCVTGADKRYRDHIEWYPDATFVRHADMGLFPYERFLSEIDVLFGYETFYDAKVLDTARRMGVHTVLMGMPELTRSRGLHGWYGDPHERVWPTSWRVPAAGRILPVPVDLPPSLHAYPYHDGPLRVLHVAGARAVGDRNGTDLFIAALGQLTSDVYVRICVNDGFQPTLVAVPPNVTVEILRDTPEREQMYTGMHVLVLPRRYGGLCLPAQEAAAGGLAVVLPDCEPNRDYPAQILPAHKGPPQRVPVGKVPTFVVEPRDIATAIDALARNPDVLALAQKNAQEWAGRHGWDTLAPRYDEVLRSGSMS